MLENKVEWSVNRLVLELEDDDLFPEIPASLNAELTEDQEVILVVCETYGMGGAIVLSFDRVRKLRDWLGKVLENA